MHTTSERLIRTHADLYRRRIEDGLLDIPFSHVATRQGGLLDLQLSGALPDDWCLRLANGLSATKIGLLNGHARRVRGQTWICQLEIERQLGSQRMPDFLDIAMQGTLRRRVEEPPILDYQLSESQTRGGLLELRVVAHDAVGLLAAVLHRARAVGLAVEELLLSTEENAATHRISIKRRDNSPPRSLDRRAIASSLDQMVRSL
jgi:hypothetical protein